MRPAYLVTIHQPQYLPYIGLLAKIDAADSCVFFDTADYKKGYFDNRNRILTKNGPIWLTVPVHSSLNTPIRDVEIVDVSWKRKHLETLRQAYGKAPFFEPYFSEFEYLLAANRFRYIGELAEMTICWLLNSFGITTSVRKASCLVEDTKKSHGDRLVELVAKADGDGYLAGPSWRDYLTQDDISLFHTKSIRFYEAKISAVSYVGHNGYAPNMSAIDLLFSLGKPGVEIIRKSITVCEV